MKNPKKLTRSQKEKLSKKHMDASNYLLIKEDATTFTVQKKDKIGTEESMITLNK
jgi:hypothetical protein